MNRSDFFRGVSYAGGGIVGLPAQQMYGMAQGGLADMGYAGGGYIPSYAAGSGISKWIKRAAQVASLIPGPHQAITIPVAAAASLSQSAFEAKEDPNKKFNWAKSLGRAGLDAAAAYGGTKVSGAFQAGRTAAQGAAQTSGAKLGLLDQLGAGSNEVLKYLSDPAKVAFLYPQIGNVMQDVYGDDMSSMPSYAQMTGMNLTGRSPQRVMPTYGQAQGYAMIPGRARGGEIDEYYDPPMVQASSPSVNLDPINERLAALEARSIPSVNLDPVTQRLAELEARQMPSLDPFNQRLAELEARQQSSLDPFNQRLSELEARQQSSLDPFSQRLGELEARQTSSLDPFNQRLSELEARQQSSLDPFSQRLSELEARQQSSLDPFNQRLAELEARQQSSLDPFSRRLAELEGRKTPTVDLDPISQRLAALENRKTPTVDLDPFSRDISRLEQEIGSLRDFQPDYSPIRKEFESDIGRLREEIGSLRGFQPDYSPIREELTKDIGRLEREIGSLKDFQPDYSPIRQEFESDIGRLEQEIGSLKNFQPDYSPIQKQFADEMDVLRREIEELRSPKMATSESDIPSWDREIPTGESDMGPKGGGGETMTYAPVGTSELPPSVQDLINDPNRLADRNRARQDNIANETFLNVGDGEDPAITSRKKTIKATEHPDIGDTVEATRNIGTSAPVLPPQIQYEGPSMQTVGFSPQWQAPPWEVQDIPSWYKAGLMPETAITGTEPPPVQGDPFTVFSGIEVPENFEKNLRNQIPATANFPFLQQSPAQRPDIAMPQPMAPRQLMPPRPTVERGDVPRDMMSQPAIQPMMSQPAIQTRMDQPAIQTRRDQPAIQRMIPLHGPSGPMPAPTFVPAPMGVQEQDYVERIPARADGGMMPQDVPFDGLIEPFNDGSIESSGAVDDRVGIIKPDMSEVSEEKGQMLEAIKQALMNPDKAWAQQVIKIAKEIFGEKFMNDLAMEVGESMFDEDLESEDDSDRLVEMQFRENLAKGGPVKIGAAIAPNEFVLTARQVRNIGGGSTDEGANRLEKFARKVEVVGSKTKGPLNIEVMA